MAFDIKSIAEHFDLRGSFISAAPYGSGHINDTYKVDVNQAGCTVSYILQRINNSIFPNVPELMKNIQRVTSHLRSKISADGGEPTRETLTIVPTINGNSFFAAPDGTFWRAYLFICGAKTYDAVTNAGQAFQAAAAFGQFQQRLADIPGGPLFESIPKFHDTPDRFAKFIAALNADKFNRAAAARKEIDFALARKDRISMVVDGLANGSIPSRVTHNDTKINNVMLDDETGKGICVIDLDTVMPGSVLYDFGDEIRTTTATAAEDERDLSKVTFRMDLFESLVRGYLSTASSMLVPAERDLLAQSGALITFEIGLRFLTDFLEGDVYFKTHREGHNLDRCRTQFEMTAQMDRQMEQMEAIVRSC